MKTPLIYGSLIAIVTALLTFGLFFAGYHDSFEKMQSVQLISVLIPIVAMIVCLALAMRERRAEYPSDRQWSYGSAFGAGFLTALVAALLGAVLSYVYSAVVNPQLGEIVYQAQIAKLEEQGMAPAQIEGASGAMRFFMKPAVMAVVQLFNVLITGVLASLIIAIFFRKPEDVAETTVQEAPQPPRV